MARKHLWGNALGGWRKQRRAKDGTFGNGSSKSPAAKAARRTGKPIGKASSKTPTRKKSTPTPTRKESAPKRKESTQSKKAPGKGTPRKVFQKRVTKSRSNGITYETTLAKGLLGSTAHTKAYKGSQFIGFADSNVKKSGSTINNLYVVSSYRGKGVSQAITSRHVKGLKKYGKPISVTSDRSDGGQKFVERNRLAGVTAKSRNVRMSSREVTDIMDMFGQWEAESHQSEWAKQQKARAKAKAKAKAAKSAQNKKKVSKKKIAAGVLAGAALVGASAYAYTGRKEIGDRIRYGKISTITDEHGVSITTVRKLKLTHVRNEFSNLSMETLISGYRQKASGRETLGHVGEALRGRAKGTLSGSDVSFKDIARGAKQGARDYARGLQTVGKQYAGMLKVSPTMNLRTTQYVHKGNTIVGYANLDVTKNRTYGQDVYFRPESRGAAGRREIFAFMEHGVRQAQADVLKGRKTEISKYRSEDSERVVRRQGKKISDKIGKDNLIIHERFLADSDFVNGIKDSLDLQFSNSVAPRFNRSILPKVQKAQRRRKKR